MWFNWDDNFVGYKRETCALCSQSPNVIFQLLGHKLYAGFFPKEKNYKTIKYLCALLSTVGWEAIKNVGREHKCCLYTNVEGTYTWAIF